MFGVAVSVLYYGLQVSAAPAYPGFSFIGTTASELGSDLSPRAGLFNAGIMVQGACTLLAAAGYWLALRATGVNGLVAALTASAVVMNGVQTVWAGFYPMPDPRHGGHPVFIAAMILLPVLLTLSLWRGGSAALRVYLVLTIFLLAAMVPIMSGMAGVDTRAYRGLVQRVFTLAIFPPISAGSLVLMHRLNRRAGAVPTSG